MTSLIDLRLPRILPLAALALVAVACHKTPESTMQVKTHSAVVSNVARYRTYSHETAESAPKGYAPTAFTPEVLERVRQRIDVEMEKKGYVLVPAGELVVRISSGVRTVEDEPTGATVAAGAPVDLDRIGALVVDVFDRSNEGHLFHGYAKDELRTKDATDAQIDTAVRTILEPLPARR
ncbi:MAG: DUF4136 domain-containing protein [Labilithrix sp.]|nr:DUF4136 domain-containing protein [Labilithrix sp.]